MPQGEPNPEVQNADVGEGNQEEEANGVIDDGIVVDGEPEEEVPLEETADDALLRARAYLQKNRVKPFRGENNEA